MPDFTTVCEEAARVGAATLMDWFGRVDAHEKGPADLVTEADYASQEAVRRTVLEAFPDHAFLGEESTDDGPRESSAPDGRPSEYRWIVDPLDGTTNYVHGVPHFCVSLALERSGDLIVGCVYNPITEECYTAAAGQGAQLDGQPIHTSEVSELAGALASAGFPSVVAPDAPDLKLFLAGLNACQAIRRTGSAALNMSYVAAGRFDVAWSFCTKIWDVAAGALLIREAGGVITAPDGGVFDFESGCFLAAANPTLHARLVELSARAGL